MKALGVPQLLGVCYFHFPLKYTSSLSLLRFLLLQYCRVVSPQFLKGANIRKLGPSWGLFSRATLYMAETKKVPPRRSAVLTYRKY